MRPSKTYQIKTLLRHPVVSTLAGFVLFIFLAALLMYLIESGQNQGFGSFFSSLWFSIVTVTTVGYGDISPASVWGQALAIFIIFAGIGYSGVLTGSITSWLVERNRRRVQGLVPLSDVEGKFLICGFKPDMRGLLKDILKLWQAESSQLILLNRVNPAQVQALRKEPGLENFLYSSGDDTDLEDLKKAGADQVGRALVLADQQSGRSPEERDFQSILTSLALNRLNPNLYQSVELLQPKFGIYLKRAKVEELLPTSDYARMLLCKVALMSGTNNLFQALFSLDRGLLKIRSLGAEEVGQTYGEVRAEVQDALVLGLLENQGNLNQRKAEKMAQVQRSPSIGQAIEGLIELKHMNANEPLFNPPPGYVITEHTGLIVLECPPGELNLLTGPGHVWGGDHRRLISAALHEQLALCEQWSDYFDQLEAQGYRFYTEQEVAQGVEHLGEAHSFKELGLSAQLSELLAYWYDQTRGSALLGFSGRSAGGTSPQEFARRHPLEMPRYRPEGKRQGQLLILGWKNELPQMLHHLLAHQEEPHVRWQGITVAADLNADERDLFAQHFGERPEVSLVLGDPTLREVLHQAGIERSKKVLVLAETGRGKSFEEIDAQTVLAAMLAGELNRRAYVAAELLDRKYRQTLAAAQVEEIVCFDRFSNILLAHGSHGLGMANVIGQMVDMGQRTLELHLIDPALVDLSFAELVRHYQRPGALVLGLLEEAGNLYDRKSERIHRAQVQPAIQNAVDELMAVKQITANQVLLSPPMDHKVKPHSRLILLYCNRPQLWQEPREDPA